MDVVGVLKVIQSGDISKQFKQDPAHAFMDAQTAFYAHKQGKHFSNSIYLELFKDWVEALERQCGLLGVDNVTIKKYMAKTPSVTSHQ